MSSTERIFTIIQSFIHRTFPVIRNNITKEFQPGDIYSFAIICSEIASRSSAWDIESGEIDVEGKPFRASNFPLFTARINLVRRNWSSIPAVLLFATPLSAIWLQDWALFRVVV